MHKEINENVELAIHIPVGGRHDIIARGSGIVSLPCPPPPWLKVYFEGNLYGAENLKSFEQRVMHAAQRCVHGYPTVACSNYNPEERYVGLALEQIGTLDYARLVHELRARRYGPGNYIPDEECVQRAWCLNDESEEKILQWITPQSE